MKCCVSALFFCTKEFHIRHMLTWVEFLKARTSTTEEVYEDVNESICIIRIRF